ncbi:helix-turn-helix domain-containing protein [Microbacterium dauci]|uniref:Helix-turn-helix domain-containing protein n=1 Tax=Microbacterium dauci TaxID=3048008 RepID=A0ABT6ZF09_9MICO|nr:helix-turn-helix domain-containing protein [Microbacterium sp. LX3-4]MDJ1114745.1 helix-turn-helix domain-containing protein [Microbacterium sp. LX3-4]
MTSELDDLHARAARHAALGDPTRLRIIDLLRLGDRSPSELQHRLDISSNLLAHHLGVLAEAGLTSRSRSEGDRRRSYLHLMSAATDVVGAPISVRRVLFVCTANSARSQLAEHLWRDRSDIPAASAGTVPAERVAPGAVRVAAAHGLDLSHAVPRLIDEVAHDDDLRIAVCDNAHELLGDGDLHWSVPDPAASGTDRAFEAAFTDLRRRIDVFAPFVTAA